MAYLVPLADGTNFVQSVLSGKQELSPWTLQSRLQRETGLGFHAVSYLSAFFAMNIFVAMIYYLDKFDDLFAGE